jgi:3-hydroxybutyryl-CoA dehydrogenase
MNIAVKGSEERVSELNAILSSAGIEYNRVESTKNIHLEGYDVVFDLNFDDDQSSLNDFKLLPENVSILLSSVKIQLESVLPREMWKNTIGINALPTFLKRSELEYCTLSESFNEEIVQRLGWVSGNKTASRTGLVSPRVVCMIINEAYYTYEEGTASKSDIDLGMKLGTAYPFGPFEWCEKIGIGNVYETLSALYNDTRDVRYKICSSLKTEYLKKEA